jgi:glutamate/tyrosine decarboxylase-like PLP-dependent enzyme
LNRESLRSLVAQPCESPLAEPSYADAQAVLQWALRDFEQLPAQRVGASGTPAELAALLAEPLPEAPSPFATVLDRFTHAVMPYTYRIHHPAFLAFVPSAPTFTSILGDWLAAAANCFAGVWVEGAGPAQVEVTVLEWFRQLLSMPAGASGLLTSGGSEANLTALIAARERLPAAQHARACLYVSEQRHWSVDRGARVMGLRPEQIRPVPVDAHLRLDLAALERLFADDQRQGRPPLAVVATAGTTNTGAIDPLPELAHWCRARGIWLHVDAAYGWANVLDPDGAAELAGLGEADSITLDPHKWLAQGYDVGALLVRDPATLERAFVMRPEYLEDVAPEPGEVNFSDRGIALTRRFRALKVWFSLKVLGVGWHRQMVTHTRRLAQYASLALAEAGLIVDTLGMSIVCFHHPAGDDDGHRHVLRQLREEGEVFFSSTRLHGKVVWRFCFVNPRTTAETVDRAIDRLRTVFDRRPSG